MSARWEAILALTQAMRPAVIESAFRERPLWQNIFRQAGIADEHAAGLRAYLVVAYDAHGFRRPSGADVLHQELESDTLAHVAHYARGAIRDGAVVGVDRSRWIIEVPISDEHRIAVTLEEASRLDCSEKIFPSAN